MKDGSWLCAGNRAQIAQGGGSILIQQMLWVHTKPSAKNHGNCKLHTNSRFAPGATYGCKVEPGHRRPEKAKMQKRRQNCPGRYGLNAMHARTLWRVVKTATCRGHRGGRFWEVMARSVDRSYSGNGAGKEAENLIFRSAMGRFPLIPLLWTALIAGYI